MNTTEDKIKCNEKEILKGIKVIDFGWAIAGPLVATYLGFLGATVITVESTTNVDPIRQTGPFREGIPEPNRCALFAIYNPGKYSLSLSLKTPQGMEIGRRLIKWADVMVENFAPGVTKRLKIDYQSVKKINPSIIYASSTQLGQTGPHAHFRGMGVHGAAMAGLFSVTGWPDGEPVGPFGPYTDLVGPKFLTPAILAALLIRHHTGKGQYIEQSQAEAGMNFIAPALLDYTANKVVMNGVGNRAPNAVPHGAYRCKGDDRWCVIAIYTDEEWKSFVQAIGAPQWIQDRNFATFLDRKKNEEELDALIGMWTSTQSAETIMLHLQEYGVPCGIVTKAEDLIKDPQLEHRHHYWVLNHRIIGPHNYEAPPFTFSKTPIILKYPGPLLGEHNKYICEEILGMGGKEFSSLEKAGVFQ